MSKFGPVLYFWSDLPNFWYVSYRLIGKHYFIFFSTGFLFFLKNNVCIKNVAFPSGFLCNSLLKEKQKNSIVFYQIFAYVISRK